MMRSTFLIGMLLGPLLAGTAFAGGAACAEAAKAAAQTAQNDVNGHNGQNGEARACCKDGECKGCCNATAQECLDHMAAMFRDRGWAGLELDMKDETGALTVSHVVPGSPAMQAGFLEGDVLVALNGVRLDEENQEKVYSAKDKLLVGTRVTYTVDRGGVKRDLPVTLAQMPEEVLEAWIGKHMLHDHVPAKAAAELAKN